ncbi:MAG TPA: 7-cyano-7-deazaguanine synthase [bacterium]|nr:7-cyano-7-deazaguanine synthase [bacterium]
MLHVQYGQRTETRERQSFHAIADALNCTCRRVIRMDYIGQFGGSGLTDTDLEIPVTGIEPGCVPITYVPFRNANLFAAAVSWAEVIGAGHVYVGINQMDSSGYPDCTREFLDAFNHAIRTGTRPDTQIEIVAPLMVMSKAMIVTTGVRIGAPLDRSWSCYKNSDQACGLCDSCRLRLAGFKAAGIRDPIPYEQIPEDLRI